MTTTSLRGVTLDHVARFLGIGLTMPTGGLSTGVAGGGCQRIGVDVVHLPLPGVREMSTVRRRRSSPTPGAGVHQRPLTTHGGQQPRPGPGR